MPVSWHSRGCKAPLSRIVSGAISSELALPLPFYLAGIWWISHIINTTIYVRSWSRSRAVSPQVTEAINTMVVFFKMISSLVVCIFQLKSHEVLPSEKVASMSFIIQKVGKVREINSPHNQYDHWLPEPILVQGIQPAGDRSHKHDVCLFHNDFFFSFVRISSFVYDLISYYSITDNIIQLIVNFRHILQYTMTMISVLVLCSIMLRCAFARVYVKLV